MHDARFSEVDLEAFVERDCGGEWRVTLDATRERCVTREREIVCIAAVFSADGGDRARQTPIESASAQVGECGRCRRALRQVLVQRAPAQSLIARELGRIAWARAARELRRRQCGG